jgi:ubiquinone/menaquinone biosynthesis C-methylase UbiE
MSETDKVFAGSVPENYDRYMVPLIFEPYAADIARRAASLSPSAVLETAAGSGVVTRALAPRLSRSASYVVTDLNQPMLDYAASQQPPDSRIKWRQADALALPFEKMRPSTSFVASSARCSFPTAHPVTAKQGGF